MHLFLTIIAFVVIFSLLILIHELGHFIAAKRAGVKVEEFSLGLPSYRLFSIKRGETIYSLSLIPFGGFVRMLGEGDDSKEAKTSKRSYSNQPLRVQAWIACAGVVMNFLLAFVLLTVGFWVGIEPLIATQDDFEQGIDDGIVHVQPGIAVVSSAAVELNRGDRFMGFNTVEEWMALVSQVQEEGLQPTISVSRSDGTEASVVLTTELLSQFETAPLYLSRLVYKDREDAAFHGLLQEGDVLLNVEGYEIFTSDDLNAALEASFQNNEGDACLVTSVYRPSKGTSMGTLLSGSEACLPFPQERHPVVNMVMPGSPAELAGLMVGDEILRVQGVETATAQAVVEATTQARATITYEIRKAGATESQLLTIPLGEDGRIGVGLGDSIPYYGRLSFYSSASATTLMGIDAVSYGWRAPIVALEEMWRLGKITAVTFMNVVKQFVLAQGVPEGVSGPVGIAQMTGVTLTQGWAAMLRFVAMLSLSLGVINILPFPAVDGGHFLIILLRALSGKKSSFRWEYWLHFGGFLFLMAFILYITFNDVLNLF